jgi:hypothetical protein
MNFVRFFCGGTKLFLQHYFRYIFDIVFPGNKGLKQINKCSCHNSPAESQAKRESTVYVYASWQTYRYVCVDLCTPARLLILLNIHEQMMRWFRVVETGM